MNKKIILTFVLLIFAQQEFYTTENETNLKQKENIEKKEFWEAINNWVNCDSSINKTESCPPKLWWLWAITDNVPIQYGNSKRLKHGEAYYGLSNGIICFFPSFLNFGWLKIGICDAHFNVINFILFDFKFFTYGFARSKEMVGGMTSILFIVYLFFNIHVFSIKILKCIKIKLLAPFALSTGCIGKKDDSKSTPWYIRIDDTYKISWWYALLSPRIEINIPKLINYLKKK